MEAFLEDIKDFSKVETETKPNDNIVVYDPFEPVPRPTIAELVTRVCAMKALIKNAKNENDRYICDVADWLSVMSNTLNGKIDLIRESGKLNVLIVKALLGEYDEKKLVFSTATRELIGSSLDFWPVAIDIARSHSIIECVEAMSGNEKKKVDKCLCSEIFFPCIYIALALRSKANLLVCNENRSAIKKILSEKAKDENEICMSVINTQRSLKQEIKNDVERELAYIYYDDDEVAIKRKISKAYCLPKDISEANPVLDIYRTVIFPAFKFNLLKKEGESNICIRETVKHYDDDVETVEELNLDINNFEELKQHYAVDKITPQLLKSKLVILLVELMKPIRTLLQNEEVATIVKTLSDASSKKKKAKK